MSGSQTGPLVGFGCGEGDQGGLDQGGVLGRAAALEPGTAGVVVGDREVPTQVRDAVEPVEGLFVAAVLAVGVDHTQEPAGELLQVGGVQRLGLTEQYLHPTGADLGVAGQGVDGTFDDLGLRDREPAIAQRLTERCQHRLVDRRPRAAPRPARCPCARRRRW